MTWHDILINLAVSIVGGLVVLFFTTLYNKLRKKNFKLWNLFLSLIIGLVIGFSLPNIVDYYPNLKVTITNPTYDNNNAHCVFWNDSTYKITINGTSEGIINSKYKLLLWVYPVTPPSETSGWYLQKTLNGINKMYPDGSWVGVAQIGDKKWTPNNGDVVDISVSIAEENAASDLLTDRAITTRSKPFGIKYFAIKNIVLSKQ